MEDGGQGGAATSVTGPECQAKRYQTSYTEPRCALSPGREATGGPEHPALSHPPRGMRSKFAGALRAACGSSLRFA